MAVELIRGLQRVFLGDDAADELGIARSRLADVVRIARPLLVASVRVRAFAAGGGASLIARGYRERDGEMDRMPAAYGVTHQMVDDAPAAPAS
ncbi:hypothetical protein [Gordonia humi]|uniref:Uncharacterized protein n=1 Tax=Gordonia humi TaxID=686429 RepID=A0A840F864_9ACTN|nr:hypothetical protein [Gordonia humi]